MKDVKACREIILTPVEGSRLNSGCEIGGRGQVKCYVRTLSSAVVVGAVPETKLSVVDLWSCWSDAWVVHTDHQMIDWEILRGDRDSGSIQIGQ